MNIYRTPTKHLFIHIPKTAGSSIVNLLNEGRDGTICHRKAEIYKRKLGKRYKNFFSFTFVRNPWDRVVSLYNFQNQYNGFNKLNEPKHQEFERFLKILPKKSKFRHPMVNYITNNNKIIVNYIGRFETLEEDLHIIFERVGRPLPDKLPHKVKTDRKHYTEYYNDKTMQIVAHMFRKDIEVFGYEYGES